LEDFLKTNEYTLKVICLFVAATFAVLEYLDYRQDVRVEKTVKIYENLYLKNVQPARISLETLMYSSDSRKELESLLSIRGGPEEFQKRWRQIPISILSKAKLDSVFIDYVEFFDVLQACIDAQLCDQDTAKVLFGTNPRDKILMQFYCPYVGYLRAIWQSPSFGEKARKFTNSKCELSSPFR
jgi:hypothetical protein